MDETLLDELGPLRYAKDVSILLFSVTWPVLAWKYTIQNSRLYYYWIFILVAIGSIPLIIGNSYVFFFVAGLRWVLLLHSAYGLYVLFRSVSVDLKYQKTILYVSILLSGMNNYFLVRQLGGFSFSSLVGVRLPGMFGNAGATGYFAVALAILGYNVRGNYFWLRFILYFNCFFGAVVSGTRFSMIFVLFLMSLTVGKEAICFSEGAVRQLIMVLLPIMMVFILGVAVNFANNFADRGDIFDNLSEGGRLANFIDSLRWFGKATICLSSLGKV